MSGKIVTNDFNLNKVAQLRGVPVLNINELANSLKPVVLPGEVMRVFIIKEGKEAGQGVGYLDDGTMVVVDQAKQRAGQDDRGLRHERAADDRGQDDLLPLARSCAAGPERHAGRAAGPAERPRRSGSSSGARPTRRDERWARSHHAGHGAHRGRVSPDARQVDAALPEGASVPAKVEPL